MVEALDLGPSGELEAKLSPKLEPCPGVAKDRSEDTSDAVSTHSAATTPTAVDSCNDDPVEDMQESPHLDNQSLVVQNTFLEFGRREPIFPRGRAYSDWSGAQARREAGLETTLEELVAPLPKTMRQRPQDQVTEEHAVGADEQWQWGDTSYPRPPDQLNEHHVVSADEQCQWGDATCGSYDGTGNYWQMRPEECWAMQAATLRAAEPEPPKGKPIFRPKWYYGSTWPFNTAPTTLLLGNLPPELTQLDLLSVMDRLGFSGFYDFVFLPMDLKTGKNQGPAIVNITRHAFAVTLATHMHEFSDWGVGDNKSQCSVKWSLPMQGLIEHVEAYRNHQAMHDSVPNACRPMLFVNGWQAVFPEPNAPLRSIRRG